MKYRYLEKRYCPGSYDLKPVEPGDLPRYEGVVRFHLPALLIDIEKRPEMFTLGEIRLAEYEEEARTYVPRPDEWDDDDVTEPVVVVEYGPDEWRIIDGWWRVVRAIEIHREYMQAWILPAKQAMSYLFSEEDVRRYINYWNYRTAYWERRDRINGYIKEDRPEFHVVHVDPEATWNKMMEETRGKACELPTRWNRWFSIRGEGRKMLIYEAQYMERHSAIVVERRLFRKYFIALCDLYDEWESSPEEDPVRKKARKYTNSYEYVFSMIRQYATEKKCDIIDELQAHKPAGKDATDPSVE